MEEYEFLSDNAEQGSVVNASDANEMASTSVSSVSSYARETILEFDAIARIAAHRQSQFKDKNGNSQYQDVYRVSAETASKLTAVGAKVLNNTVYVKAAKDACLHLKLMRCTREDGTSFLSITTNRSDEERQMIAQQQTVERAATAAEEARLAKIESIIARFVKLGVSPDKAAEMAMSQVK